MVKDFKFEDNSKKVKKNLDKTTMAALEKAALIIEGAAKSLAPVDSGELRDKVDHTIKDEGGAQVAKIGSPLDYAPYIEFGTGEFAENGSGRKGGWFYTDEAGEGHFTRGNKPQPFLRPAFRNNKKNIEKVIGATLKSGMDGK